MTERTVAKLSRKEDDAISLTSTRASENEGEYVMLRILAERKGTKPYLIKWKGYDDEESTWEPKKSVTHPSILAAWEKRKKEEEKGNKEKFDLDAFNEAVNRRTAETNERRQRRRAKRYRMAVLASRPDTEPFEENDPGRDAAVINTNLHHRKRLRARKRGIEDGKSGTKAKAECRQEKKRKCCRADTRPSTPPGNKRLIRPTSISCTEQKPTATVDGRSTHGSPSGGAEEIAEAAPKTADDCVLAKNIALDLSRKSTEEQNLSIPPVSGAGNSLIHHTESCPPIAPSGQEPAVLKTCFFWAQGWCRKHDSCDFLHAYSHDVQIARPPPSYVGRGRIRPGRSPWSDSIGSPLTYKYLPDRESQNGCKNPHSLHYFEHQHPNPASDPRSGTEIPLQSTNGLFTLNLSPYAQRRIQEWRAGL